MTSFVFVAEEWVRFPNQQINTSYQRHTTAAPFHLITTYKSVKQYFIAFSTSYLVEKGFIAVFQLLCKQRNRQAVTDRGNSDEQ